jgi:AraC family transcriptional regulator
MRLEREFKCFNRLHQKSDEILNGGLADPTPAISSLRKIHPLTIRTALDFISHLPDAGYFRTSTQFKVEHWHEICCKLEVTCTSEGKPMPLVSHGEAKYRSAGKILASSSGRDWSNVILEKWAHEAGLLPTIVPQSTEISIQLSGASTVEREGNGVYQKVAARPGTVWLCPAGVREEYVHVRAHVECLHIYIPETKISEEALGISNEKKGPGLPIGYHTIPDDRFIAKIGEMALNVLENETSASRIIAESLGFTLAAYLCREYSGNNDRSSEGNIRPLERQRLMRVCDFIDQNITRSFGIEDLARVACQSPSHFSRSFRAALGISPAEYVGKERFRVAKAMLLDENLQIGEISRSLGFSSQANFSRSFRGVSGMTPNQYRAKSKKLVPGADFPESHN